MQKIKQTIIKELLKTRPKNRSDFDHYKSKITNNLKIEPIRNSALLAVYKSMLKKKEIKKNPQIEKFLQKRSIRTLSGVAIIAVLTKPYKCPGKCAYCPDEKNMPKSYLSNEPAVMRAILCKFDPYKQVKLRLRALVENGHPTDKIELIIMGGTWSFLPKKYQTWFIKRCFDALNVKTSSSLTKAQKLNEKAKCRCIGLTLETRPDYITPEEIKRMRGLGATRVEMGVQHIDDIILKKNNRGHNVEQIVHATQLLKQVGFKISYHMMPNLPGSTPQKDIKMFEDLFSKPEFQPDMLKIYPTVVTRGSKMYRWWKQGKYKPYSDKVLFKTMLAIKKIIPYYARISRLIRDIPAESIEAGSKISNLRQFLQAEMNKKNIQCKCIRCREARQKSTNIKKAKLFIKKYQASEGIEYFLSYEDQKRQTLYAFLRLRIPTNKAGLDQESKKLFQLVPEIKDAALVRELHTYGQLVPLKTKNKHGSKIQHEGFGKKLMKEAEKIVCQAGYKKIAVISGIGVRGYYSKLGYKLMGEYMVKALDSKL